MSPIRAVANDRKDRLLFGSGGKIAHVSSTSKSSDIETRERTFQLRDYPDIALLTAPSP